MNQSTIIELIGYCGSLLVVISMLMTSVIKLRIINTIGSVIFAGYAFVIHSYPTAFMNLFLVGINVYNLVKLIKNDKNYQMIEVARNEAMLKHFLEYHEEDIHKYFPDFVVEGAEEEKAYVVYNDTNTAGVLIGKMDGDTLQISLDYTAPMYRDCSVGDFLYSKLAGQVKEAVFAGNAVDHAAYMERVGFVKEERGYVKPLV